MLHDPEVFPLGSCAFIELPADIVARTPVHEMAWLALKPNLHGASAQI